MIGPAAEAQARPLEKTFTRGAEQRYQLELTLRSEVSGIRAIVGGGKAYTEPFTRLAEERLSWETSRRVLSVTSDGSAEIEEVLHNIHLDSPIETRGDEETQHLREALHADLLRWTAAGARTLRYTETQRGKLFAPPADAAPLVDQSPPVLSLWLIWALRPTVSLPEKPVHFGERWQEPRIARLEPWRNVSGTESGEWLPGPGQELSIVQRAQLHVVQQMEGEIPPKKRDEGPPGKVRFHAESLATVAVSGSAPLFGGRGSLEAATRSASTETIHSFERVPGQQGPLQFVGRITAQVRITKLE